MKDVNDYFESNPIEILTSPSESCPYHKCDGSGRIWIKDWSKRHQKNVVDEWQEECDCYEQMLKQREIDRKLDLSGIPPIFTDATVRSFQTDIYKLEDSKEIASAVKTAAINYVKNFELISENGKGLYLYSSVKGSGKTRLASSIANALVSQHGADIAFVKSMGLMAQIKKTYTKDSELTESDVIASYRQVGVLIIDDLAIKNASPFEERVLYDVTDYRLEHKKPTIFTSNVPVESLENFYPGGRVNKRVKKMTIEIYMPEESIRDLEAEQENEDLEKIIFG